MCKKMISAMLGLLLFCLLPVFASDRQQDGNTTVFTGMVENSRYLLKCQKETGDILLRDKATGQEYAGVPSDAQQDPVAKGIFKMGLNSQLVVRGVNILTNQLADIMSYPSSVKKEGVQVEQTDNGFCVTYHFTSEKLIVPVYFLLDEDRFVVKINTGEITEGEKFMIKDIEVLPYLGAGGQNDEGFIMVPDGSGAIIRFNNQKASLGDYTAKIYGRDDSFYLKKQSTTTEDVRLPVFGIEKNGYGFLAVASKADAAGKLMAGVAGTKTSYNYACFGFTLHSTDTVYINKDTWYEKGILKYNTTMEIEDIEVSYYCYTEKNGGYFKMAQLYRSLFQNQNANKTRRQEVSALIHMPGAIDVDKSVLGIPMNVIKPLSTFDQTGIILDELQKQGMENLTVKLSNITAQSIKFKRKTGFSPLNQLGGKKGLKRLLEHKNVSFYADLDIMAFDAGLFRISAMFHGSKSLSKEISMLYTYDIADYSISKSVRQLGLLKPDQFYDSYNSITEKVSDYNFQGISPGAFGSRLYSDFNQKHMVSRQQVMQTVSDTYQNVLSLHAAMTAAPNAYAVGFSDLLTDIPDESSKYDVFDGDIPFYSLVLNGFKDFTYGSVNLKANTKKMEMRILESGAIPQYTLFYQQSDAVKDTRYASLFSCHYKNWLKDAAELNREQQDFAKSTGKTSIVSHQMIQPEVFQVTYENGSVVMFNYSNAPVVSGGITVDAASYKILEGR